MNTIDTIVAIKAVSSNDRDNMKYCRLVRGHQGPRVSILDCDLEGLEIYLTEGPFANLT